MSYHYKYNRTLLPFSRQGRREQTDAEKKLWFHIRNRRLNGYKFRRQYPIRNYVLDFFCREINLAIELDGSQHISRRLYDENRSKELEKLGIQVVRFWDNEVLLHIESVLEKIIILLENYSLKKPHPDPLLKGEGEKEVISKRER